MHTTRSQKELSRVTVSGYNKADVLQRLVERLRLNDVAQANHWAAELVCSNHIDAVLGRVVAFVGQEINAQNPRLPSLIWQHVSRYRNMHLDGTVRNNQIVRNLVSEVVTVVAMSHKKVVKLPKIGEIDFEVDYIRSKVVSTTKDNIIGVIRDGDPPDIVVPINELATHIILQKRYNGDRFSLLTREATTTNPYYWLAWFLEWEKNISSKKMKDVEYRCAPRLSRLYDGKFATDCVWVAWDLFRILAIRMATAEAREQIAALYNLYAHDYSRNKRTERKFLMYQAIQVLTLDLDWRTNVYVDRRKVVKTCACVNFFYRQIAADCRTWEDKYRSSTIASFISPADDKQRARDARRQAVKHVQDVQNEMVAALRPLQIRDDDGNGNGNGNRNVDEMFAEREAEYERVSYEPREDDRRFEDERREMISPPPNLAPRRTSHSRINRNDDDNRINLTEQIERTEGGGDLDDDSARNGCVTMPVVCSEGIGCVYIPRGETPMYPPKRQQETPHEFREFFINLSQPPRPVSSSPAGTIVLD